MFKNNIDTDIFSDVLCTLQVIVCIYSYTVCNIYNIVDRRMYIAHTYKYILNNVSILWIDMDILFVWTIKTTKGRLFKKFLCVRVVCIKTFRTYDKGKSYNQDTHKYTVFGSLKNGPFIEECSFLWCTIESFIYFNYGRSTFKKNK